MSNVSAKKAAPKMDVTVEARKASSQGIKVKSAVRAGYASVEEPVAVEGYQPQY